MKLIKGYQQWLNENFTPILEQFVEPRISGFDVTVTPPTSSGLNQADFNKFLASEYGESFRKFSNEFQRAGRVADETALCALLTGAVKKKAFFGLINKGSADMVKAALDLVNSGKVQISYEASKEVKYQFDQNNKNLVRTRGTVYYSNVLKRDPSRYTNTTSKLDNLLVFINQYNTNAYALNKPQYCLSERLDDGFIDLLKEPGTLSSEYGFSSKGGASAGSLFLYSTKKGLVQGAEGTENTETQETGGQQAATSQYETDFATGSSDCTTPKVAAAVKAAAYEIAQLWPAGSKGPDTFKLTSGASADWNGKLPNSTGSGQNFTGSTQNEKSNQKLAYDRGFKFMTAVNAELQKMGHPGFPKFEVSWVIGDTGGPAKNGKYVDLMLQSQAIAPTVKTIKKYDSKLVGDTNTGATTGIIYEFELMAYGQVQTTTPAPKP